MPKIQVNRVYHEIESAYKAGYTTVSEQGSSRCFAPGTLVRMYDGSLKCVEDITVGDKLMNISGDGYNTVMETHSGIDNMYRVKQARGIDYVVNSKHILAMRQTRAKQHKVAIPGYKSAEKRKLEMLPYDRNIIHDFPVEWYMSQSENFRKRYTCFKKNLVQLPEIKTTVDPYYFGLWIGDGLAKKYYAIANIDKEVLDYFYAFAESLGTAAYTKDGVTHLMKVSTKRRCVPLNEKIGAIKKYFYSNNLICNKYVPKEYIYNSYENRLKFLAGLIDSDGCVTSRNTISITQKKREILEAVLEICRLSGFYTNGITEKTARMKRNDGSIYECKVYIIEINHNNFSDLNKYILCDRKRIKGKQCDRDYFVSSVKIESVGLGEYYGFTLDNSPYFLLEDGTVCHNSGKTFNTTIWLIVFLMMHPNLLLSVVRKTLPALKGSVLRDFKENLLNMGIWNDKAFNKSELIYTFPNGSQIEFFSTDDEQKIRGRKRHILYANEANELAEIEWQQLKMRTTMFSIMDYNPSFSEEHWINAVNADPRTYHFITTYKDNPFLEQTVIDEIESLKYKNKTLWQVYGLGLRAIVEGLIFKEFEIVDEVPEYAKKKRWRGMDFGYSNDETAIVDVYPYQDILYLDEICYRTEMLTSDIVQVLKANDPLVETISESADPRLVQEIYRAGVNIHPVHKFPGSIEAGITKMLEYKLVVTKRSINLIKELRNYTYAQDKEGKWLNKPIDAFNHCFTGDTLITTNKGDVPIKDIQKGDIILTSSGWQSANKLFANGYKKVLDVTLVFLNFRVTIKATPEHLFKTTNGWKKLEHLTKGDVLFALSNSKENDILTQKYARTIAKSEDNIIRYSEIYTNQFMGLSQQEPLTMPKTETMPMSPLKTLQQNASAEENVRIEPSLMGKLITCIRTRSITLKATKGSMSRSGSSITEKFLSAAKFITKTLIRRIMIFQTLNASRLKNTKRDIENGQVFEGEAKANSSTLKQSEKKLKSGTKAKKVGNGILNTESEPFSKKRLSSLNAKSAEKNTIQHSTEHDSVQISAGQSTAGSQELIMKSECASAVGENLQLTSIQNPPFAQPLVLQDIIVNREETQQVYDIEVNNTHEYFANGVLVHNCTDAIRYVVIMKILGGKPRPVNLSKIANKAY